MPSSSASSRRTRAQAARASPCRPPRYRSVTSRAQSRSRSGLVGDEVLELGDELTAGPQVGPGGQPAPPAGARRVSASRSRWGCAQALSAARREGRRRGRAPSPGRTARAPGPGSADPRSAADLLGQAEHAHGVHVHRVEHQRVAGILPTSPVTRRPVRAAAGTPSTAGCSAPRRAPRRATGRRAAARRAPACRPPRRGAPTARSSCHPGTGSATSVPAQVDRTQHGQAQHAREHTARRVGRTGPRPHRRVSGLSARRQRPRTTSSHDPR